MDKKIKWCYTAFGYQKYTPSFRFLQADGTSDCATQLVHKVTRSNQIYGYRFRPAPPSPNGSPFEPTRSARLPIKVLVWHCDVQNGDGIMGKKHSHDHQTFRSSTTLAPWRKRACAASHLKNRGQLMMAALRKRARWILGSRRRTRIDISIPTAFD